MAGYCHLGWLLTLTSGEGEPQNLIQVLFDVSFPLNRGMNYEYLSMKGIAIQISIGPCHIIQHVCTYPYIYM